MKKPLIILTGPTAVGKTELSIQLAKQLNGEIISADSVQVYRNMNIGSAKITNEEQQGIEHYLIDLLEPDEEFNVFLFKKLALEAMDKIYAKGKIPIIAGGTGFYIQSVLYDIQFSETSEESESAIRHKYEELAHTFGNAYLHERLTQIDPEYAATVHFNNVRRVIRALEYYEQTGEKFSIHNQTQQQNISPYQFCYFVLNRDRQVLYERINRRVELMLETGLIEEVEGLLQKGFHRNLASMQSLGYKEIAAYLEHELTRAEAIDAIKQNTRHFAKRQLTWFRREKEVTFMNYEEYQNDTQLLLEAMINILREKGFVF